MAKEEKLTTEQICTHLQKIKDAVCYSVEISYEDSDDVCKAKTEEISILQILNRSGFINMLDWVFSTVDLKEGYLEITLRRKGLEYLQNHGVKLPSKNLELPFSYATSPVEKLELGETIVAEVLSQAVLENELNTENINEQIDLDFNKIGIEIEAAPLHPPKSTEKPKKGLSYFFGRKVYSKDK